MFVEIISDKSKLTMSALVRAVPAAVGTQPEAAPIKPNLELRLA